MRHHNITPCSTGTRAVFLALDGAVYALPVEAWASVRGRVVGLVADARAELVSVEEHPDSFAGYAKRGESLEPFELEAAEALFESGEVGAPGVH